MKLKHLHLIPILLLSFSSCDDSNIEQELIIESTSVCLREYVNLDELIMVNTTIYPSEELIFYAENPEIAVAYNFLPNHFAYGMGVGTGIIHVTHRTDYLREETPLATIQVEVVVNDELLPKEVIVPTINNPMQRYYSVNLSLGEHKWFRLFALETNDYSFEFHSKGNATAEFFREMVPGRSTEGLLRTETVSNRGQHFPLPMEEGECYFVRIHEANWGELPGEESSTYISVFIASLIS
ncbi:MAG: hypothetical protein LBR37_03460 [Erysipelotrichaceae bacterium]|jgi:hypothetical protein|nr:hypothetical protein [Erysipelotrichaceae bacterium]